MKPLCVVVLLSWINVSYTCPSACSCSDNTMNCYSKNLEEIPAGIPATIQTLYLNNNQITNISAQVFEGLSALTSLYLNNNQITHISAQVFEGLSALTTLSLNNNQITTQAFVGLSALEYFACSCSDNTMNCYYKNLEEIPSGIPATTQKLYLNNNQITNISAQVFEGLSALLYLYLNNNQITHISAQVFEGLSALTTLSLNNNQITTISLQAFVGLSAFESFACSCSDNTMNCYYKNLEDIPSGIPAKTQKLDLSNNQITNISAQVFEGLSALTSLNLYNNQITNISPQTFVGLSALIFLFLNNNQITTISPQTFVGLSALIHLDLENNPLDCSSCDLETFKVFLNNQTHLGNAYAKCNGTNTYVVNHDFQNCGGGMATTDAMMTTDDMTTTDELTTTDAMTTTDDMTTLVDNSANNRGSSEGRACCVI